MDREPYMMASVDVTAVDTKTGKPLVTISFPDGVEVVLTCNLADMIGGIGRGALQRWQDQQPKS